MLYDGSNRPIATDEKSIKKALLGDTSMVKDTTEEISITYNEELGEINIWNGDDNPSIDFTLAQIDQVVKKFMSLYMEGW